MGGSIQQFLYRTDVPSSVEDEYKYIVIKGDESNLLVMGGLRNTSANRAGKEFLTQGVDALRIEPRYINLEGRTAAGRPVKRRLIAPDPTVALWKTGGGVTLAVSTGGLAAATEDVSFAVSSAIGEKRTFGRDANPDTGLDDTTQP